MKRLILFISGFAIMYLLGVFFTTTFDIRDWEPVQRFGIGVAGLMIGFMMAFFIYDQDNKK